MKTLLGLFLVLATLTSGCYYDTYFYLESGQCKFVDQDEEYLICASEDRTSCTLEYTEPEYGSSQVSMVDDYLCHVLLGEDEGERADPIYK